MAAEPAFAPTTVAEFLAQNGLSRYEDAFERAGWDFLAAIQNIREWELQQLIADVNMISGHACRLRAALGMPPPMPPPDARAPAGDAAAAAAAADAAPLGAGDADESPLPPPAAPMAADAKELALLHAKLLTRNLIGELKHGTTIQTFLHPVTGEPVVKVTQDQKFYCGVCDLNPMSEDGSFSTGSSHTNSLKHLGSRTHWTCFQKKCCGRDFEFEAWTVFTNGNQHGPRRAENTAQKSTRRAAAVVKQECKKEQQAKPPHGAAAAAAAAAAAVAAAAAAAAGGAGTSPPPRPPPSAPLQPVAPPPRGADADVAPTPRSAPLQQTPSAPPEQMPPPPLHSLVQEPLAAAPAAMAPPAAAATADAPSPNSESTSPATAAAVEEAAAVAADDEPAAEEEVADGEEEETNGEDSPHSKRQKLQAAHDAEACLDEARGVRTVPCIKCGFRISDDDFREGYAERDVAGAHCTDAEACDEYRAANPGQAPALGARRRGAVGAASALTTPAPTPAPTAGALLSRLPLGPSPTYAGMRGRSY